jgi:hypothetical protein
MRRTQSSFPWFLAPVGIPLKNKTPTIKFWLFVFFNEYFATQMLNKFESIDSSKAPGEGPKSRHAGT